MHKIGLVLWYINHCRLYIKTVLFQAIQFGITQFQCHKQFYFKQFSLAYVHSLFLFDP